MRVESNAKISVKRITRIAVFTAVALIIHIIESYIPLPVPVPGVKLGLSNVVTLFMLFSSAQSGRYSAVDAFAVLLCRIIIGSIFTGSIVVFLYSFSGGMPAFASAVIMKRLVTTRQIWVCGAVSAVMHNTGQILAAMFLMGTTALAVYLPILVIIGIITGSLTGLITQYTVHYTVHMV